VSAVPVYSEADVRAALSIESVIEAVSEAVAREVTGQARNIPKTMATWSPSSSAHALGALDTEWGLVAFKTWVNTPRGAEGRLSVFDAGTGQMLALVESGTLSALRTAAISGLATRWLSAADADEMAIVGTGRQALKQVEAVQAVRPLRRIRVWSPNAEHRRVFAEQVREATGLPVDVPQTLGEAVHGAPIVTLVTRASEPFLQGDDLAPGALLNAVGAILPAKAEFDPRLLSDAQLVVVDNLDNARQGSRELREFYGEDWSTVYTLGDVVTGKVARTQQPGPTIFKGLGMGLADLAAATALLRVMQPERFSG
jgi:alanine dehydrogenase